MKKNKIIEILKKRNKLSFIREFLNKNKDVKDIDISVFEEENLISRVKSKIKPNEKKEKEEREVINQILNILEKDPTITRLKILEEKFTGKSKKREEIGTSLSDSAKFILPSKNKDVNSLYFIIVREMLGLMSEKELNKYIEKIYDIFYYDVNKYVLKNSNSKFKMIIESTDVIKEEVLGINSKDYIETEIYNSPKIDEEYWGKEEENKYASWLKNKKTQANTRNLYESKNNNMNFINKIIRITSGKKHLENIVENENENTIKKYAAKEYDKLNLDNEKDSQKANEKLLKYSYFKTMLNSDIKVLREKIENIKEVNDKIESLWAKLKRESNFKKKNDILHLIKINSRKRDGNLKQIFGSDYVSSFERIKDNDYTQRIKTQGLKTIKLVSQKESKIKDASLSKDINWLKKQVEKNEQEAYEAINIKKQNTQVQKEEVVKEKKKINKKKINKNLNNQVPENEED